MTNTRKILAILLFFPLQIRNKKKLIFYEKNFHEMEEKIQISTRQIKYVSVPITNMSHKGDQ